MSLLRSNARRDLSGILKENVKNLTASNGRSVHPPRRNFKSISNPIPAAFLRGGTSKGIFINRKDLPQDISQWTPIFLGIMGSPDPQHARQLNGMGGGVSSLSKICVIGAPTAAQKAEGIDVEYTFAQVGIKDNIIDYSGNCGNLSSMIGVAAVDAGICVPHVRASYHLPGEQWRGAVRSFNTNTQKVIDTSFPVSKDSGGVHVPVLDIPQASAAGVPGKASRIDLEFVSPGGARTGKLLPTGNPVDTIRCSFEGREHSICASLVDATNPTVFVESLNLATLLNIVDSEKIDFTEARVELLFESLRRSGAVAMGLNPDAKAQPKIAALSMPSSSNADADIGAHAYSMGVLHKAIPMTLGLCLGVAARVTGTLAWEIAQRSRHCRAVSSSDITTIQHPSGTVEVGADFSAAGDVICAKVVRTGRRLMQGHVWW